MYVDVVVEILGGKKSSLQYEKYKNSVKLHLNCGDNYFRKLS